MLQIFFSLRNYLGRWLSLILIHLFQHLHGASVREKKNPKFCRFKKKYFFHLQLEFQESQKTTTPSKNAEKLHLYASKMALPCNVSH